MQEYTVKMDDDVPDGMNQAFKEMMRSQSAAMTSLSREQKKTQDRLEELEREHRELQAKNAELNREVATLRGQAGPPPVGVGAAAPAAKKGGEDPFEFVAKIPIHEAPVHSVTAAPGGDVVATASWDGTVRLYDLAKMEVVATLGDVHSGAQGQQCKMLGLYDVAFAKTADNILGCTSCDHSVYLWNYKTCGLTAKLTGHKNEVNSIDFHSSQQVMATASDDQSVIVWDFQEGIVLRTLDKHTKAVYGVTFLGQDHQYLLATACFDQMVRVWDMRDKQAIALLKLHTDDVIGIDYSGAKQLLATGSDDGRVGLFETRTWTLAHTLDTTKLEVDDNEVKRVCFSPDGGLLAAACSTGRVLVYDVNTLGASEDPLPYANLGEHADCVFGVAMGVDRSGRKYVVSASHDHHCFYWREAQK